tara:strand:- start:183 stop:1688 length:1506 start_codon:yes stop_codon:yes gene_type:complete
MGSASSAVKFVIHLSSARLRAVVTAFLLVLAQVTHSDNNEISGPDSPLRYDNFNLVWSDEFSGTRLDEQHWSHNIGTGSGGWGNNELQYYLSNNASVADGFLTITAKRESYGGRNYTSSRIKTEGLVAFNYGRVDIRAKLPRGQGIWPALWALGNNFSEVGWPYSGEIDIMEMIGGSGREDTVHGTVHWNIGGLSSPYAHTYSGGLFTAEDFSAGFNVFSVVRTADQIEWRVNDVPYYQFSIDDSASLAPFRKPFFLIFNVAVGGNWPGYPDDTTTFPQQMVVDYVRIFEPTGPLESIDSDNTSSGSPCDPADFGCASSGADTYTEDTSETVSSFGVTLEEPAVGLVHMGVGNLRGWAVSSAGIRRVEAFLDGEFLGEIPYGGARSDVGLAFPDLDDSDQSGFSMAFNYSGLTVGTHTIEVVAHSLDNKTASDSAQFETVRFDKEFIGAGEAISLNAAASLLTNDQIRVENISIAGRYYNLLLRWRTAEQGFEIVEIEALD